MSRIDNNIGDVPTKKKPAPRLFCDICDEFDRHDTEDCPIQCSSEDVLDPPPRTKAKKLPAPRVFCENCDSKKILNLFENSLNKLFNSFLVFDQHETEDCPNEYETY